MWTKFIVQLGSGDVGTVWNQNRIDSSFFSLGYANVTLWQWLVSICESRVSQLTDGSRGSWIIKCDSLSALPGISDEWISTVTTNWGWIFTFDNMAELRVWERKTIVVASGLLTSSGRDTSGVSEDVRATRAKPDSLAEPERHSEPGNSIVGDRNSGSSISQTFKADRGPEVGLIMCKNAISRSLYFTE